MKVVFTKEQLEKKVDTLLEDRSKLYLAYMLSVKSDLVELSDRVKKDKFSVLEYNNIVEVTGSFLEDIDLLDKRISYLNDLLSKGSESINVVLPKLPDKIK